MGQIIITGTGRCGTGFMAKFLSSAGIKCSHEGVFTTAGWDRAAEYLRLRRENPDWGWRAESSWLAVPFLSQLHQEHTIVHLVRHPKKVIESHLRMTLYAPGYGPYFRWMAQFIPAINDSKVPEEQAAYWYVKLNELVEPHAEYRHRIEDDPRDVLHWLNHDYGDRALFSNTAYNKRYGYGPAFFEPSMLPNELRARLLEMAERYGYRWEDWAPETVEAIWFDDRTVTLDARSGQVGGSWQLRDETGRPLCYDWQLVQFFLGQISQVPNPVVVDIGASTGSFSLLPLLHPCTVHAFEPNPLARHVLESNVKINGLDKSVRVSAVAVGDRRHTSVMHVPVPAIHAAVATLGDPRPRGFEWREVPVFVVRLDDVVNRADFIKIDTEGAELLVLKGAQRIIQQCKPKILLEYQSLNTRQFGYEREEIVEILKSWGYTRFTPVGIEDLWCEVES